jgi:hypothetical protein
LVLQDEVAMAVVGGVAVVVGMRRAEVVSVTGHVR